MLSLARQVASKLRWPLLARSPCTTSRAYYSPSSQVRQDKPLNDDPVRFSGSRADFDSADSFQPVRSGAPRYQPICVVLSLAVFLIYFCILREENDVDLYLGKNVFTYMDPFSEATRLQKLLKQQKKDGVDTSDTEEKLTHVLNIIAAQQGNTESLDATLKSLEQAKKEKKNVVDMK